MEDEMKITYWSDYACPYCYIGETRLEKAIEELELRDEIEVEMKAFELDPNASYEVISSTEKRFARKYGLTLEEAKSQIEYISSLGRSEGIDFNYIDTQYTNTLDAHRLTKLVASKHNTTNTKKVIKLLFDAYFTKNLKLADKDVLKNIGKQVGIEENELSKMIDSKDFVDDIRHDEDEAHSLGVYGVPYFIIDNTSAISGAQTKASIKQEILKAITKSDDIEKQGMFCGLDGCH